MFIGTPLYGQMQSPTESTIRGVLRLHGGKCSAVQGCSAVDLARSEVLGKFLESSESELLWVDADVSFDPAVVERMRDANADVITCTYRQRIAPHNYCARPLGGVHPTMAPRRQVGAARIIEIERDGLGCCLVRRHVVERMIAISPGLFYVNNEGQRRAWLFQPFAYLDALGVQRPAADDVAFFMRARAAGFKIECLVDATVHHDGVSGCLADVFPQ